ncbi:MAG TPA: cytochrome c oxidase subunit 3 [Candidatus Saccharimonadales bacterium]|jgi:cytochrome c oxidase subunit 3|nr:cytochrome c oxidase subunit 3 [Candidatus Saccharimonadales bacterium]
MPRVTDRIDIEKPPRLGGGGPGKIPHWRGRGGGDDGDDGRDDFVSSKTHLRRYRVLLAAVLISILALFVAVALGYILRGKSGAYDPIQQRFDHAWKPLALPYARLILNTLVLLLSSVALERSRRGLAHKMEFAAMGIAPPRWQTDVLWLALTVVLGFGFLAGQVMVWQVLRLQGVSMAGDLSGSSFYLMTGLHAVHLAGGLLALLYALIATWSKRHFARQTMVVEITGWYWHFMGVLWVGLFAVLHFAN